MTKLKSGPYCRGLTFLADLVGGLKTHPASAPTVQRRHGMSKCAAQNNLRMLLDLGVLRVVSWRRRGLQGPPMRVYGVGTEPSVPPPLTKTGKPSRVSTARLGHTRPELATFASLWRALETAHTVEELAEETGLCRGTIYPFVRHAHAVGLVGVASWDVRKHTPVAEYRRGVTKDAPKPKADRAAQQRALYHRQKLRRDLYDPLLFIRGAAANHEGPTHGASTQAG